MTVSDGIRLAKNRRYIPPEFSEERCEMADVFSYGVVINKIIIMSSPACIFYIYYDD